MKIRIRLLRRDRRPPVLQFPAEHPGYTPVPDNRIFPRWERFLNAGWSVLAVAAVLFLFQTGIRPHFRPTPEDIVRARFSVPVRIAADAMYASDPVLSADGTVLAYAAERDGAVGIWLQHGARGKAHRLTARREPESQPDISPDGRSIVFRSERDAGGVYLSPADGSAEPRLLAAEGRRPKFSPDGKMVAYYTVLEEEEAGAGIWVVPAEGGSPRRFEPGFLLARDPVWTPDGKFLLFDGTTADRVNDWYLTPIAGGAAMQPGAAGRIAAIARTWSTPLGMRGRSAWFTAADGDDQHLWEIGFDERWTAARPRQLTIGKQRLSLATLSRDGDLAFARQSSRGEIWSAPLDERGNIRGAFTRLPTAGATARLPSLDAAARRMLYVSDHSGRQDAWIADLGRDEGRALTSYRNVLFRPVLSADGQRALVSMNDAGRCAVVRFDLQARSAARLSTACLGIWDASPDLRQVLCFLASPGASSAVLLLESGDGTYRDILSSGGRGIYTARLSPDGRWLAFTAGTSIATARLYVAPFRTDRMPPSSWIPLTASPAASPAWSVDGSRVYYRAREDGHDCIWSVNLGPTRRAQGPPSPAAHFHQASAGLDRLPVSDFQMSVTRDRMVINIARKQSEVWFAQARKR